MPTLKVDLPVTTLYNPRTLVVCRSLRAFQTEIDREYSVEPPEIDDDDDVKNSAISRLYIIKGVGIYSVEHEGKYELHGTGGFTNMPESEARRILREDSKAFDWTGGDVRWHPYKPAQILPQSDDPPVQ